MKLSGGRCVGLASPLGLDPSCAGVASTSVTIVRAREERRRSVVRSRLCAQLGSRSWVRPHPSLTVIGVRLGYFGSYQECSLENWGARRAQRLKWRLPNG